MQRENTKTTRKAVNNPAHIVKWEPFLRKTNNKLAKPSYILKTNRTVTEKNMNEAINDERFNIPTYSIFCPLAIFNTISTSDWLWTDKDNESITVILTQDRNEGINWQIDESDR